MRFVSSPLNYVTFLALLLTLSSPVRCMAQSRPSNPLTGIDTLYVVVEDISPEYERYITPDRIRTIAELRLRQSGVTVIPRGEARLEPHLYILVSMIAPDSRSVFGYLVQVAVRTSSESAYNNAMVLGEHWGAGGIGTSNAKDLRKNVESMLGDYLDEFLNQVLAANPQ